MDKFYEEALHRVFLNLFLQRLVKQAACLSLSTVFYRFRATACSKAVLSCGRFQLSNIFGINVFYTFNKTNVYVMRHDSGRP